MSVKVKVKLLEEEGVGGEFVFLAFIDSFIRFVSVRRHYSHS